MRYKEYSKAQLEANADKLNYDFDRERLEKAKPVDVYDVIEFVGADIDWKYLSQDGSILGATVFCDGIMPVLEKHNGVFEEKKIQVSKGTIMIDIRVDEGSSVGRKNFTVMHEVFHFLYHEKSFTKKNGGLKKVLATDVFRSYKEKKKGMTAMEILEWQANYMAAAFLLPKKALINEINNLLLVPILDQDNVQPMYIERDIVRKLADKFSVSYQTLVYRLQNLNILRQ